MKKKLAGLQLLFVTLFLAGALTCCLGTPTPTGAASELAADTPAPTQAAFGTPTPEPINIPSPPPAGEGVLKAVFALNVEVDGVSPGQVSDFGLDQSADFAATADGRPKRGISGHPHNLRPFFTSFAQPPGPTLPPDPIEVLEPLIHGDTLIQGTGHPSWTIRLIDLDDPSWPPNMETTVQSDRSFIFDLVSISGRLVDGHTILVEGLGGYKASDTAVVEPPQPIDIYEPLVQGDTQVRGMAHPGETLTLTDLDDPSWPENGITTVIDPAGNFVFQLSNGLQSGHTIQVADYGESDTATVLPPPPTPTATPTPTPTPVPIVIDEPIYEGDVLVSGRAMPGATLRLRDLDDPSRTINLETTIKGDGTFTFDLSAVTPRGLEVYHELVVQGYGTDAFTIVQPLPHKVYLPVVVYHR